MGLLIPDLSTQSDFKRCRGFTTKFSKLLPEYSARSQPIAEIIEHHFIGQRWKGDKLCAVAKGFLRNAASIQPFLDICQDKRVQFRSSGAFVILIEYEFGSSWIPNLKSCLRLLIRLCKFLRSLEKHKLNPTAVSLDSVSFNYSTPPEHTSPSSPTSHKPLTSLTPLSCTLSFPPDPSDTMSISLSPRDSNPHLRIKSTLEYYLSNSPALFLHILEQTTPLLRSLSRADAHGYVSVRSRGAEHYRLAYPSLLVVFDIVLRNRRGKREWHVMNMLGSNSPMMLKQINERQGPELQRLTTDYFALQKDGWRGKRNLMVCSEAGIEPAIDELSDRLHELIKNKATAAKINGALAPPSSSATSTNSTVPPGINVIELD